MTRSPAIDGGIVDQLFRLVGDAVRRDGESPLLGEGSHGHPPHLEFEARLGDNRHLFVDEVLEQCPADGSSAENADTDLHIVLFSLPDDCTVPGDVATSRP
jgi:hypothetical protein